ncbi:NAD-dependent epimerase/dehydratase family protein [Xanthobacter oligotrophicus]|uniref:NAD-dependent epimerase/dehydratase family protein n=1 Tax=Xanthobacter oligotrophicus TaxID=2607286 RepID=UPI0011F19D77|nr:NAD-dependent epimerase/dehydratase family protein [Xanthobacter oligotrophicus]MCG5235463.1 NAD-dependent epimerase/dehydratase family protein [Xanthobacter oligotrophicus]
MPVAIASQASPRIGLVGATGSVGASIAAALTDAGTPFAAIGRSLTGLTRAFTSRPEAELSTITPELRTWNPDDPATIRGAFRGLETLVYMVGVPYDAFHLHPQLMARTVEAAAAEGVSRLLLIGTAYPFGRPQAALVDETHPRTPHTFKGQMRKAQEDVLMEADAAGLIRATILRLPDFYGPGVERSFLSDIFAAAAEGRRAKVIGPIDGPHQFVFVPDVGPVVRTLLATDAAFGRTFNLGGAGTISVREVAERAFALANARPRLMVANKTMLRLAGLFDPVMRELVEMNYLMTTPVIMDDTALQGLTGPLIGPMAKTSYADGIARTMAAATAAARASRSRQAA